MTISEALAKMEQLFPDRYVTATVQIVRYSGVSGGERAIEYSLYVEDRRHFRAASFEGCFAQIPEANPATDTLLALADAATADASA